MTLRTILQVNTESEREKQLIGMIDRIGEKTNAKVNKINRIPHEINHMGQHFPEVHKVLNGETKGIIVRKLLQDDYVQLLEVSFGKFGFCPAHTHPHYSVVHVVSGKINDAVRHINFIEGDWFKIDLNEVHSTQSIDGAILHVYNTDSKLVADTILIYQGYDPNHPLLDRLKINES